jgi:Fe-S-cluster containining protein
VVQPVAHPVPCARCGTCCRVSVSAYVEEEDLRRWQREERGDILATLARERAVWAGNHLVSALDGHQVGVCPFLALEGATQACAIYPTRPRVCREYVPGSSAICPQYLRKGVVH